MSRVLAILLVVVCGLVLGVAKNAEACQCVPPDAATARARAKFIAEGRVDANEVRPDSGGLRSVRLSDIVVHKGPAAGAPALTFDNGNDCPPVELEVGKRYLMYMARHPSEQGAAVTFCNRVVLSSLATAELKELSGGGPTATPVSPSQPRASASPSAPSAPSPVTGGCASCQAAGGGDGGPAPFALGMMLMLWGLNRRRSVR
jgi:MYXO-CTERM domain-containing protein